MEIVGWQISQIDFINNTLPSVGFKFWKIRRWLLKQNNHDIHENSMSVKKHGKFHNYYIILRAKFKIALYWFFYACYAYWSE